MTASHTKMQVQRSVSSKDRMETNRQTDATDCFTFLEPASWQ